MWHLIAISMVKHQVVWTLISYWSFSAFVSGMPAPKPTSGTAYEWLYNSLHKLSGDLSDYFASKFPTNQIGGK